jgi:hypothetical protein
MTDKNKLNLQYFEGSSMKELHNTMMTWQTENQLRLLSLSISKDRNKFGCIALINPTEVIIKDGWSSGGVDVRNNALKVYGV